MRHLRGIRRGVTDRRTDGPTDRRTYRRTDRPSYSSRIHAVIQDDDASTIISQEPALRAEGPMDNLAERKKTVLSVIKQTHCYVRFAC